MGYIENSSSSSEQVKYKAQFHWLYTVAMVLYLVLLGPFLIGIFVFLEMLITKLTTELGVTTSRLVFKTGWISRKTEEISLGRIEEMNLEQSVLGRLLGYGKLRINGTGGSFILTPTIDDPLALRKAISEAIGK